VRFGRGGAALGSGRPRVVDSAMRFRFEMRLHETMLVLCSVALAALVYSEGWIWPLKAAAVMIPVSLLIS
jgi:hypothetical protein